MNTGTIFRDALKRAGVTDIEVAKACHVHYKTVGYWKTSQPPIEMWRTIAELCNDPSLIDQACKYQCPLGCDFVHTPMNNINCQPAAIIGKYQEEGSEIEPIIREANKILLNYMEGDTPTLIQEQVATKLLKEMIDEEGVIIAFKSWYKKVFGLKKFIEVQRAHTNKCLERGYIKQKSIGRPAQCSV